MDAVELLREMVAIPSPSGGEGEVARFLAARMDALGLRSSIDAAGNAVGMLGDGPRELVLLGHLDTVPGGPPVEIRDGKLWGRGSVDAKGPLAAFVVAAAAAGAAPGWRLVVIGAVEEEAASSKGARHVAARRRPEACVIGEPSGWDAVTLGYKGRLVADATVRQPTRHSAGPEPSSAERLVGWWNAVAAFADGWSAGRRGVFAELQRTLQSVSSTVDGNVETARATLGFRLPPGLAPEALRRELLAIPGAPQLAFSADAPAWTAERDSPLARAFRAAIRAAGARPRLKHKTGTSDMNVVGPAWGCPILAYGPGDSGLDHTPWEHLEIAEYRRAIEVLRGALDRLRTP